MMSKCAVSTVTLLLDQPLHMPIMHPKDTDGLANSIDTDQTVSGPALFDISHLTA